MTNMENMKNSDLKTVVLNLNEDSTIHTNPDITVVGKDGKVRIKKGKKIAIKKIGEEYFSKRDHSKKSRGASEFFPNHLEFKGWLSMNSLAMPDGDELED